MPERQHFMHFLEGVNTGVLLLVMLGGFIAQFFIFRTHTRDFEIGTKEKLEVLVGDYEALEVRMDQVAIAESALSTDIANLKRQIDRLEDKVDDVLKRLR